MTNDKKFFIETRGFIKLNYSTEIIDGVISIPQSDYFKNFEIGKIPEFKEELIFNNCLCSFDILGAAFYLLARVEEYGVFQTDSHNRFSSNQSILFKKNLIEKPVVDYWFLKLKAELESRYKIVLESKFQLVLYSTIDIDHIYAYAEKPLIIRLGSMLRDLLLFKFQRLKDRFVNMDPYDTFDFIIELHQKLNLTLHSFILTSKRGSFDKSLSPDHPSFVNKISKLSEFGNIGIHPSYASNSELENIRGETKDLENVIGKKVTSSRQHFVRLEFPKTYRSLLEAGIKNDYSMGYPDCSGFRAGTSRSFMWYDIEEDNITSLRVHSFQLMDVTLRNYEKLSAESAIQKAKSIIDNTRKAKGSVCVIWHNSSFYTTEGWTGWKEVYEKILSMANQKNNNTLV